MYKVDIQRSICLPVFDPCYESNDRRNRLPLLQQLQQRQHHARYPPSQQRRRSTTAATDSCQKPDKINSGSVHFEIPDDEKHKKTEKKLRRVKVGKWRSLSEDSKQKDSNNEDQENKVITPVVITERTSRPSSYARFKYPVKFHSSERRRPLTCDVPDCLRRPSSGIYWMMPVRQGPRRKAARSRSPSATAGRTESPPPVPGFPSDDQVLPEPESSTPAVIELEQPDDDDRGLPEQNADAEATADQAEDQTETAEQYADEDFEEEEGESDKENDSVTSNKEQDAASSLEDSDAYTRHAFDKYCYDYAGDRESYDRRAYLVFHGLPEGGKNGMRLIKRALEALGLDPNEYIEDEEVKKIRQTTDLRENTDDGETHRNSVSSKEFKKAAAT